VRLALAPLSRVFGPLAVALAALAPQPAAAAEKPTDAALAALAEGRTAAGLSALEDAAEADPAVLCLLGLALQRHGAHDRALQALGKVPLTAPCGRQAAFTRADALLALGKAEPAAALYDEVGAPAMGPDRDAAMAALLVSLADRVLADPDADPGNGQAVRLLELALGLRISPARQAEIARRLVPLLTTPRGALDAPRALSLATAVEAAPSNDGAAAAAAQVLARALSAPGGDVPADRLLYARVAEPSVGLRALAGLSDRDPEVLRVRAALAGRAGEESAVLWRERLLDAAPETDAARRALPWQTQQLLAAHRIAAARPLVAKLATAGGELGADAEWRLVVAVHEAGEPAATVAALEPYLKAHPTGAHRNEALSWLDEARLALARAAAAKGDLKGALAAYDLIATRDPSATAAASAAWEAGLAARALGQNEEARRRWRAVVSQWPDADAAARSWISMSRALAFDEKRPEEALAMLRENERRPSLSGALAAERERLAQVDVRIQSSGRQDDPDRAQVRVVARNLTEVEMRMHRVEPEAYLRAGGTPEELLSLDVAVIAPDVRWKATVPGEKSRRDVAFDVPLPVRAPGIYVVTAAATDREASTVVLVSDLDLVARAVGPDLAVGVFRAGKPVAGAELMLRFGDTVRREKTGRDGLYVGKVGGGALGILALDDDAPALLTLSRDDCETPTPALTASVELDRPVYRPGDTVGFRVAARRGGAAVPGPWKLWLSDGGTAFTSVRLTPGPFGSAAGERVLPPVPAGMGAPVYQLMLLLPGEQAPMQVAEVRVADVHAPLRTVSLTMDAPPATGATLSVFEPDGRPAVGAPVSWRSDDAPAGGRGRTDATGRLHIDGPAPNLPWSLEAGVAGAGPALQAHAHRFDETEPPFRLTLDEDRLRPGEKPVARLRGGAGPVRLLLSRLGTRPEAAKPPADPWVPEIDTEFHGPVTWTGAGPRELPGTSEDELWRQDVFLTGGDATLEVALPPLAEGRFRLRVVRADARVTTTTLDLSATGAGVRLLGGRDVAVGQSLSLRTDGGLALVTVESDRLLGAALGRPGVALPFEVTSTWGQAATIAATTPDGKVHARGLTVDPELKVALEATASGGVLTATARVTDGRGRPVAAQVVLRAVDTRLEQAFGPARELSAGLLATQVMHLAAMGGVAHAFAHGAFAEELAEALRDEQGRVAEAERAEAAARGQFSNNAVQSVMKEDYLIGEASGAVGYGGLGSGGSGAGYGRGRIAAAKLVTRGPMAPTVQGERGPVLWRVLETNADGRVTVTVPRPDARTTWHFTAQALSADATGRAEARVVPDARPFLRVPTPGPGAPDDVARLVVTVVNPGAAALNARVKAGDSVESLTVPPGEARLLDLGERPAGTAQAVALLDGERVLDTARFGFALADGRPDASGPVLVVAAGPGGGRPLGWLALQMGQAPGLNLLRAARAGRAALAALSVAAPAERAALTDRILALGAAMHSLSPDSLAAATEHLRFVTEGRELLERVRGDLEAVGAQVTQSLPAAETPAERVAALLALVRAGLEIDESALDGVVQAAAELPDEAAAQLAQLLVARKRGAEARPFVRGEGPEAALASRLLGGAPRALAGPPPDVESADRVAWILAQAQAVAGGQKARKPAPGNPGRAEVRVAGQVVGEIDLASGGVLRVRSSADPARDVVVAGAPGAMAWRISPPATGDAVLFGMRVPGGADGTPLGADLSPTSPPGAIWQAARCGTEANPCRLNVGDALSVGFDHDAPGFQGIGGLVREPRGNGGPILRAVAPGRFTLRGIRVSDDAGGWRTGAPLNVSIGVLIGAPDAPTTPVVPAVTLAMAEEAAAGGADPTPVLGDESTWPAALRAGAARLRFDAALQTGAAPADLVARFERLRELDPSSRLELDQILRIARAYRTSQRPERAVAVWRAGLGAAFLGEAGGARGLEDVAGLLASVRAMRELTGRYPALPVVAEALFHLPERLGSLSESDTLPPEVVRAGITATDLRLMAAAWDREFLALNPESPRAAEAGFHLVEGLFRLRAFAPAADWAERLAERHADAPVLDGLLYIEGLARAEQGQEKKALALFDRLATGEFPEEGGAVGPAASRDDARFAAARLLEARGDLEAARTAYAAIEGRDEAAEALHALKDVRLKVEPIIRQRSRDKAAVRLDLANLDEVHLRVYKLDLRTIFLRDAGLGGVLDIRVSGVSPTWAGARRVEAGPFPRGVDVDLPVRDAGAYLVQVGGGGQSAATLLLRSDLEVAVSDAAQRRVQVRWRDGRPGKGAELRAISGSPIAERADLRGVAHVPAGAPVLAFDGEHFAYAPAGAEGDGDIERNAPAAPAPTRSAPSKLDMMKNIDERLKLQRSRNQEMYEQQIEARPDESVEVNGL
jgi:TolA-binding protein